jgi:hypothetical protein
VPVITLIILFWVSGNAWACDFRKIEKDLHQQKPPIVLSKISKDGKCYPGADKIACRLSKDNSCALLIGKEDATPLRKEADAIDKLQSSQFSGYKLNTPSHGDIFQLTLFNSSKPKLKKGKYSVMLEDWITGSKIDNEFQDFVSPPKNKEAFDKTQLGQAISDQRLNKTKAEEVSKDIKNYRRFVNDQYYIVDLEFFVTGQGELVLVDLAGGEGKRKKAQWLTRLQNASDGIDKYY